MYSSRKRTAAGIAQRQTTKRRKTYGRNPYQVRPTYRGFNPRAFARGEWKYHDVTSEAVDLNSTLGLALLNGIVPGTGAQQRIGQSIKLQSIEMRIQMAVTANTGIHQLIRIWIVQDKQPNATAMTAAEYLSFPDVHGMRNLANRKRFKTIMDKEFNLTGYQEGHDQHFFHKYIKFKSPINVDYNTGTAGTIGDISSNALYVLYGSSMSAGDGDAAGQFYLRLRYTDV